MTNDNDSRLHFTQLVKLANDLVWRQPSLDILRPEFEGKYSLLAETVQEKLKLSHQRGDLILPDLRAFGNQTVAIFSDYGGEHKQSRYLTYSTLVFAWNLMGSFHEAMREIRREFQLGDKEIAYKDFRMGQLLRSLPHYLRALDMLIPGFLFTMVVDKRVLSLYGPDGKKTEELLARELETVGITNRKPKVNKKLLRVVELSAFLAALLAQDGQKIFWVTDNDSIAPSPETHEETLALFGRYLNLFARDQHTFPTVGGALPFAERSVEYLDLLSVADICAGAISEFMTKRKNRGSNDFSVKNGSHHVLQWLANDGVALKKMNIIIEADGEQTVSSKEFKFSLLRPPEDAVIVPIIP